MDRPRLVFSSEEEEAYSERFRLLTKEQNGPVQDRVRFRQQLEDIKAISVYAKLKVHDDQIEQIWGFMEVDSKYISLHQFMIGLRLCSAVLQGKDPTFEELYSGEFQSAQGVIKARTKKPKRPSRSGRSRAKESQPPEEDKRSTVNQSALPGQFETGLQLNEESISKTSDRALGSELAASFFFETQEAGHKASSGKKLVEDTGAESGNPPDAIQKLGVKTKAMAPLAEVLEESSESDDNSKKKPSQEKKQAQALRNSMLLSRINDLQSSGMYSTDLKASKFPSLPPVTQKIDLMSSSVFEHPTNSFKPVPLDVSLLGYGATPQTSNPPLIELTNKLIPQDYLSTQEEGKELTESPPASSDRKSDLPEQPRALPEAKTESEALNPRPPSINIEIPPIIDSTIAESKAKSLHPVSPTTMLPMSTTFKAQEAETSSPRTHRKSSFDALKFPYTTVNDPKLINLGWLGERSFTLYTIKTFYSTEEIYQVDRRFKDLEWFYNQITQHFKGYNIPPLPEKSSWGNTSDAFVEERRLCIEKFLNLLLRHYHIGSSKQLRQFLVIPRVDLKVLKAQIVSSSWPKFKSLESTLDLVKIEVFSHIAGYFSQSRAPINSVMQQADFIVETYAQPTQACVLAFGNYTRLYAESIGAKSAFDTEGFDLFNSAQIKFGRSTHAKLNNFLQEFRGEQFRVEGLRNARNCFADSFNDVKKLEKFLQTKQAKQRKNPYDSTYTSEIIELETLVESTKQELSKIEEALNSEVGLFKQQRSYNLSNMLIKLAKFMQKKTHKEKCFWFEVNDRAT